MGHFIGKITLSSLIGVKVADINFDGDEKKCLIIPIRDNDIVQWNDEWQLWFRAFAYKEPKNRFTHFLMKFIPRKQIKNMSYTQLEAFANHNLGGMIKTNRIDNDDKKGMDTADFIKENM